MVIPTAGWIDVRAVETDKSFERWTTTACAGQPAACHLLIGAGTTELGARFGAGD